MIVILADVFGNAKLPSSAALFDFFFFSIEVLSMYIYIYMFVRVIKMVMFLHLYYVYIMCKHNTTVLCFTYMFYFLRAE